MTHTPAPWLYARVDETTETVVTDEGDSVCDVRGASPADLSLIVNAPALLAALRELVAEWDTDHADEDHRTGYTLDTGGIAMARAAIARATG